MDNLDDSENNAKISDSAYSNSCSNSQSRRSHSSKSTHSGSNSSGSSGYGGKPSTSGSSKALDQPSKKDKESKKKKQSLTEVKAVQESAVVECRPPDPVPLAEAKEEVNNVIESAMQVIHCPLPENPVENMDITTSDHGTLKDEVMAVATQSTGNSVGSRAVSCTSNDGFTCVISMHDGVVMYTTSSLTMTLGYPKEMWISRSFIDFVHPRDRNTFASQITNGLAIPKIVNGTQEKAQHPHPSSTMVCRIRKYRSLNIGFGIKENKLNYMPFLLKFTFKNINDDEGKIIYLVMQATPFFSAFKSPHEKVPNPVPFVMRHDAKGHIKYIEPESVPYLGYMPQDIHDKDALQLYHPEDLPYLRQIYETIVKEGSVEKSKSYRMLAQNGDYVRLETEWSSFINPWSMKLEFIIGKHHILEGPLNPDVFQSPEPEHNIKISEEEKIRIQGLKENIIRIMNEVLTKPAEAAKQQMSKRCQDLANIMETLMEDQPKTDEELRLEIQDPDHSYYERDSVMLGGISPHHEYNDSKSSTETPLSYNQLNYNETLQRYFERHQPYCYEDYNTVDGENVLGLKNKTKPASSNCPSLAQRTRDSNDISSDSSGVIMIDNNTMSVAPLANIAAVRLTESLLMKHNAEMEKELVKMHRDTRSTSKEARDRKSNETRQKKKAHLARCNATFQPSTLPSPPPEVQTQGVKRSSKPVDVVPGDHKHHCISPRHLRRRQITSTVTMQPPATVTNTVASTHWAPTPVTNMNTFFLGVGIPQQISLMNPMPAMPGVFPMYYAPAAMPSTSTAAANGPTNSAMPFPQQPMQCFMYGQPMYGQPFMYSPISPQISYPMQQTLMAQTMQYSDSLNSLGLPSDNYNQSTEAVPHTPIMTDDSKSKATINEETVDRTDGESSYSSFYSSFFKTESGSAEDSGNDRKKSTSIRNNCGSGVNNSMDTNASYFQGHEPTKIRRKMEPPWLEQVCVTSELIYKYQILTKTVDEVLLSDKQRMATLEQPSLVNEQLGQLYLDLQLEGVAARLTLEEGITSSSSSGEDTPTNKSKVPRRKRDYSKLMMIYEEEAPFPPPSNEDTPCLSSCATPNPRASPSLMGAP